MGNGCILVGAGRAFIVKFCVLASGSSGNAALLATGKTRILVDAGLSMRETGKRLRAIGESLGNIDAIVITHEHSDHVGGLPVMARNKDVRAAIYLTRLTAPRSQAAHRGVSGGGEFLHRRYRGAEF